VRRVRARSVSTREPGVAVTGARNEKVDKMPGLGRGAARCSAGADHAPDANDAATGGVVLSAPAGAATGQAFRRHLARVSERGGQGRCALRAERSLGPRTPWKTALKMAHSRRQVVAEATERLMPTLANGVRLAVRGSENRQRPRGVFSQRVAVHER
jgi:hypothetical protein